jgi:hypothetical protein
MTTWFPAGHLVLSLFILIWNVTLAGRITQVRQASRGFATVNGLIALLLLPAVLLRMATATFITGRAVVAVDWLWPLVVGLVMIQAIYAVSRHLVNYFWGVPILVYDVLLFIVEITRYGIAHGVSFAALGAGMVIAASSTLAQVTTPIAATTPFFFLVPIIAPAYPALRRATAVVRAIIATVAVVWVVLIPVIGAPAAVRSISTLNEHSGDQIHERPLGDFSVGLKIFPDVATKPAAGAVANDLQLVDSLGVGAVEIVITPGAAHDALDSIARIVGRMDDSTTVIVAVGYRGVLVPELGHGEFDEAARLKTVAYVAQHIHPDILLPAEDPLQVGERLVGHMPLARWESYVTSAAAVAKRADPTIQIGVSVSRYSAADSALYAWAAGRGSPVDIVGFSLFPEKEGLADLTESFEKAADRWMKTMPPTKPHWIFAVGGFPLNSGEQMQDRVVWNALSWATGRAAIKGLVVYEASDYAQARGLRAPNGRLRAAATAVRRAIRGLKESITG